MSTDFLDFNSSNINQLPDSSGVYMIKMCSMIKDTQEVLEILNKD